MLLFIALWIGSDLTEISVLCYAQSMVLNNPLHLSDDSGSETISKRDEDLCILLQSANIVPMTFNCQAAEIIY